MGVISRKQCLRWVGLVGLGLLVSCGSCEPSSDEKNDPSDNEPPDTAIIWNSLLTVLKENRIALELEASEADCTFECQLDEQPYEPCSSLHVIEDLNEGPHEMYARATDPAGNTDPTPARFGWTVDTQAPIVVITQAPPVVAYDTSATFAFESPESVSFQCALDEGANTICSSPVTYSDVPPGLHTFTVVAVDTAGNSSDEAKHLWRVGLLFGDNPIVVDDDSGGVVRLDSADLDNDGDRDVVSVATERAAVKWHANDGNENFEDHVISEEDLGVVDVAIADVDGDGDSDVVTVSTQQKKITWYQNDGRENFEPVVLSEDETGVSVLKVYDVDGDGDEDILVGAAETDQLVLYEHDGNYVPKFERTVLFSAADGISDIAVADIDADGDQDVVMALAEGNRVTILYNQHEAGDDWHPDNLTPQEVANNILNVRSVVVIDIDNDGDTDLVSAASVAENVLVHENDGEGGFTPRIVAEALPGVSKVIAADMDDDGDVDLMAGTDEDATFYWFDNLGDDAMSFNSYSFNAASPLTLAIHLADIDLDGDQDLISGAANDHRIFVEVNQRYDCPAGFTGDDCQTCTLPQAAGAECGECFEGWTGAKCSIRIEVTIEAQPIVVTIAQTAEFEFSSNDDVTYECTIDGADFTACTSPVTYNVEFGDHVFRVRGITEGGYVTDIQTRQWFVSSFGDEQVVTEEGHPNQGVVAGDLDADGDQDLVVASANNDNIIWYENTNGDASAFVAHVIENVFADGAYDVQIADINADGALDVLAVSQKDDRVSWYENDGAGTPSFMRRPVNSADEDGNSANSTNGDADGARSVFPIDVNGDGNMDLLVASFNDDKVTWYRHNGGESPSFTPVVINNADVDGNAGINGNVDGASHAVGADIDGDGDIDIVSASNNDDQVAWFENVNNEDFEFHVITQGARGAQALAVADLDKDGDVDILVASYYDDTIVWLDNDGTGQFTGREIDNEADGAQAVIIVDIDGDTDLDIVAASRENNQIRVYYNDGNLNFATNVISTQVGSARDVFAVDMDADGDVDILTAGATGNRVVWYPNQIYNCDFGFTGAGCDQCTFPQASGVSCDVCQPNWGGVRCSQCLVSGGCF
ncbi:MAG: hypothetical protein CMH56_03550 [Myxococcales bacterium]|nr:hypothetical protein [Myxococcales bacterium]